MVIFTDLFVPKEFDGYTYLCFALIRPQYKNDKGLIEHEKTHVKQFWKAPFIHGLLYRFSDVYRLKSEVEAYRAQIKVEANPNVYRYATMLSKNYGLKLTVNDAKELLEKP